MIRQIKTTYYPMTAMCANCAHKHSDCSELVFARMPIIKKTDTLRMVNCVAFERLNDATG